MVEGQNSQYVGKCTTANKMEDKVENMLQFVVH